MNLDIGFVCIMGIGTVFAGLVCIILLCKIYAAIINLGKKDEAPATVGVTPAVTAKPATAPVIEDKQKIIAAVCAAVAEELGTDVNALKVISFKKI